MRVLIAEDDFTSLHMLKALLSKWGYEVVAACDGKEAWQILQSEDPPQLAILDWMMPEMDGLTICRKIREANSSHYVYLILLTSKDRKEDALSGFEAGADEYIVKPFNPEELGARIRAGQRILQLEEQNKKTNLQMLQSEKMASIGQLAAGVAHEINNPTAFVSSNLKTLSDYQNDTFNLIRQYRDLVAKLKETIPRDNFPSSIEKQVEQIVTLEKKADVNFILDDTPNLIKQCRKGTERIKKIVLDLKNFAHPGEDKVQTVDINKGIESTLNIVWNELKYKAEMKKEYGHLPLVKGYSQQLNQVFMNILVNAAQAIKEHGEIRIATRAVDGYVDIEISDTGVGIPKEDLSRIFDPFFTTKDVGKGTGLGLNIAYNIIKNHKGTIDVESEVGTGTTFIIRIPVGGIGEN